MVLKFWSSSFSGHVLVIEVLAVLIVAHFLIRVPCIVHVVCPELEKKNASIGYEHGHSSNNNVLTQC